jgi:hypothetical protein
MDYDAVADLPLTVDSLSFDRRERDTSSGFTRATTVVSLSGAGERGRGEDVTYDLDEHDPGTWDDLDLPLSGEYTLESFSETLDDVALFPEPPERDAFDHYRRWGFESAALDLALRQADATLGERVGRSYDPVRFVVSTRLTDAGSDAPPDPRRVTRWLDANPDLEFKLDPTPDWDDALVADLAATGAVRILDCKGHYEGTEVETEPDPALYERLVSGFPDAIVEDPGLTDETRPVLAGHEDRIAWDAPITGVESIEALPFEPDWLNVKPSRFGTVASLFETLDYCEARDIRLYGGGQFELGVGRRQIQALASLCYPDGPNDVAPRGYNDPEPGPDLPASPLEIEPPERGFGWGPQD